jgi:type II secretory pathway pseudopilin PulG
MDWSLANVAMLIFAIVAPLALIVLLTRPRRSNHRRNRLR